MRTSSHRQGAFSRATRAAAILRAAGASLERVVQVPARHRARVGVPTGAKIAFVGIALGAHAEQAR